MIDRLEELLGIVEKDDEDENEKDEYVVEAGPLNGPGRRRTAPAQAEPAPSGEDAGENTPENDREAPAALTEAGDETVPEGLERAVRGTEAPWQERGGVRPSAEDSGPEAALPAPPGEEGPALPAEGRLGEADWLSSPGRGGDQPGLELLYRAAARAAEPAAELLSAGQTARRTLPDPVPSEPVRMTVEEMDRAMRRDSRRYDGGMTIY